jgi:hypothetical protein
MRRPDHGIIVALLCTMVSTMAAQAPDLWFGAAARWTSDAQMHRVFLERFAGAVGLGRSRMVSPSLRVHDDMRLTLTIPADEGAGSATIGYELKTLELIGVARHPDPVAFVIGTHTERSEPARTRSLDGFERRAIASLRSGQEVVARTTPTGRQVVGAIRATAACASCHATSAERDVLGAFSYTLTRVG